MTSKLNGVLYAPGERVAVEPPRSGRIYWVRNPTFLEKPRWRHSVAALGGRRWGQLDLAMALRREVERFLGDDPTGAQFLEAIDGYIAGIETAVAAWRDERSDENSAALTKALVPPELVTGIETQITAASLTYANMQADRASYREYAGIAAAQMFLGDWEGKGLPPFRRTISGVPDELMNLIPSAHMVLIGDQVELLVDPPELLMGNSDSAFLPLPGQTPSGDENTQPENSH
ncbi:MAG: hypothetical protein K0R61_1187 [Microvirga sp.]|jgi:hypothetical protein|nr:hypothetical protein [Microvirga sp.]MDF2970737.1 hypothetical protein [Microvirga sp.]